MLLTGFSPPLLCKRARTWSSIITGTVHRRRLRSRRFRLSAPCLAALSSRPAGGQDSFDEFANPDDTYEELLDRLEGVADTQVRPLEGLLGAPVPPCTPSSCLRGGAPPSRPPVARPLHSIRRMLHADVSLLHDGVRAGCSDLSSARLWPGNPHWIVQQCATGRPGALRQPPGCHHLHIACEWGSRGRGCTEGATGLQVTVPHTPAVAVARDREKEKEKDRERAAAAAAKAQLAAHGQIRCVPLCGCLASERSMRMLRMCNCGVWSCLNALMLRHDGQSILQTQTCFPACLSVSQCKWAPPDECIPYRRICNFLLIFPHLI